MTQAGLGDRERIRGSGCSHRRSWLLGQHDGSQWGNAPQKPRNSPKTAHAAPRSFWKKRGTLQHKIRCEFYNLLRPTALRKPVARATQPLSVARNISGLLVRARSRSLARSFRTQSCSSRLAGRRKLRLRRFSPKGQVLQDHSRAGRQATHFASSMGSSLRSSWAAWKTSEYCNSTLAQCSGEI